MVAIHIDEDYPPAGGVFAVERPVRPSVDFARRGEVEGGVFTLEPVRVDGEITDFRLVPCTEGPADMIQEVFDGISAELKGSTPFHSFKIENNNKEVPDMKCAKMAYESFNAMNRMGRQMMSNMMGRMGQMPCGAASR